MSEVYNSYTHGPIPLSFTGRRLMQNLRDAIVEAIAHGEYSDSRNQVAFARGEIAKYISKLEASERAENAEEKHSNIKSRELEVAGDILAHELCFRYHKEALERWWKVRDGRCTYCEGV